MGYAVAARRPVGCGLNLTVEQMEANREHLDRLLSGVPGWNEWRRSKGFILAPDLEDASFRGMNLAGVNFSHTNLCSVNLAECNLEGASFIAANLSGTRMPRANLRGCNFADASFHGTDLSGCDVTAAQLAGTLLRRVNLDDASLERANLVDAVFSHASLRGTRFRGARLASGFEDVDLSSVIGLDEVQHVGPSSVSVDTLNRSKANLSKTFLRDAGVPDTFIAYIDSLTSTPIEFQSCFISYSNADRTFAQQLYADLRQEGIRSWFAPEDLKIGDRFRREIDRSILVHDRLLVVLSESSVASAWVEDEVEAALERERQTGVDVLFPIQIDDAVMTTKQAWAGVSDATRAPNTAARRASRGCCLARHPKVGNITTCRVLRKLYPLRTRTAGSRSFSERSGTAAVSS